IMAPCIFKVGAQLDWSSVITRRRGTEAQRTANKEPIEFAFSLCASVSYAGAYDKSKNAMAGAFFQFCVEADLQVGLYTESENAVRRGRGDAWCPPDRRERCRRLPSDLTRLREAGMRS